MVRVYVLMCIRVSNSRVLVVIFTESATSSFCVLMFAYVLMCVCTDVRTCLKYEGLIGHFH